MLLFPLAQVLTLLIALSANNPAISLVALLISCTCLSLSVHICFHEFLHLRYQAPIARKVQMLISLCCGLSFEGYKIHHHNHHQFNNAVGDISSTWQKTERGLEPIALWRYALFWPKQVLQSKTLIKAHIEQGLLSEQQQSQLLIEKRLIGLFFFFLVASHWQAALVYFLMVYLGWAMVSVHNYGQHFPHQSCAFLNGLLENDQTPEHLQNKEEVREKLIYTVTNNYNHSWYNVLLFNNGLHTEHHLQPHLSFHELSAETKTHQIAYPPIVYALILKLKQTIKPSIGFNTSVQSHR